MLIQHLNRPVQLITDTLPEADTMPHLDRLVIGDSDGSSDIIIRVEPSTPLSLNKELGRRVIKPV